MTGEAAAGPSRSLLVPVPVKPGGNARGAGQRPGAGAMPESSA